MRIIKCDRCNAEIREADVYKVSFSPYPKNVAHSVTYFELCDKCVDVVYKDATRPREKE